MRISQLIRTYVGSKHLIEMNRQQHRELTAAATHVYRKALLCAESGQPLRKLRRIGRAVSRVRFPSLLKVPLVMIGQYPLPEPPGRSEGEAVHPDPDSV